MARPSSPSPLLWIAAVAAAAAGGVALYRMTSADDEQGASARSGDSPACPPGTRPSTSGECVSITKPKPSALAIPPNPRVLFVGDRGALLVAERLNLILQNYQVETGNPAAPANTTIWDGQGPYSIESFSVAPIPDTVASEKPDVAVVMLSQWNAVHGPVDGTVTDELVEILTRLTNLLPKTREEGAPATNILLVRPFSGARALLMSAVCDVAALKLAPRVFPVAIRTQVEIDDGGIVPTEDGALVVAQQLAELFVSPYTGASA